MVGREMINEPVAIRYDFDGYGYLYMDSGSGSDLYARRNWDHGTLLGGDLLNYFGVER